MIIHLKQQSINYIAIFLALFYAFATRSVIGPFIFHGFFLIAYYVAMYISLAICFLKSFQMDKEGSLFAPKGFWSILVLFIVIMFSLSASDSLIDLRYYIIALLLPFALVPQIKLNKKIPIIFILIGIVLFIGCAVNYFFPVAYRVLILPLFTQTEIDSIEWQLSLELYYPGFTSQVGYTSFFFSMAIGALFCFRKEGVKKWFIPLISILILGMLFTGKRGPMAYLFLALVVVFYFEDERKRGFLKVFQIFGVALGAYILIVVLDAANIQIGGISRIFESINEFLLTGDVEDPGRSQLYAQAMVYFRENPVFGIGWNGFKKFYTLRSTHCHNIYYQLLCETGIVGTVIFVTFFVDRLSHTVQYLIKKPQIGKMESAWIRFSLFIQVYFLLYGLTGNPLYDIEETILYFFAIGISFLPTNFSNDNEAAVI